MLSFNRCIALKLVTLFCVVLSWAYDPQLFVHCLETSRYESNFHLTRKRSSWRTLNGYENIYGCSISSSQPLQAMAIHNSRRWFTEKKAGSTDHNLPQSDPIWKQDHVNQQSQVPNTSSNSLWVKEAVTGIQNRLCWVTPQRTDLSGREKT